MKTSSPKLTVPQVSEHESGSASSTRSRPRVAVTDPPSTAGPPARSAPAPPTPCPSAGPGRASARVVVADVNVDHGRTGRLAGLRAATSSSRVTGSAGTSALLASAPVGATVIIVLAAPWRSCHAKGPAAAARPRCQQANSRRALNDWAPCRRENHEARLAPDRAGGRPRTFAPRSAIGRSRHAEGGPRARG